mmetsp:Transcript_71608/g.232828  ORF Transcript_71608/g.232828 Transcript_71608/m.232828 type:complete len:324 (-) Transcript_71608:123-1094(-)
MKRPAEDAVDESGSSGDEEDEAEAATDSAAPSAGASGGQLGRLPGRRKKSQVTLSDGRVVSSKVRNHVNPLLPHFQKPVAVRDWSKVYKDLSKPIVLDLGCAKGRFCLEGAKRFPEFNWLGIEIREPLVVRANEWVVEEKIPNLHYIFGNASAGIADLLASMPTGMLRRVTVQCPDPCFKKKHQKRRMVTDRVISELADGMLAGSYLFVQSDVEQVSMQMADVIAANGRFERVERIEDAVAPSAAIEPVARPNATVGKDYQDHAVGGGEWEHKGTGAVEGSYNWLQENPLGLMSERESSTLSRSLPIFRALYRRKDEEKKAAE